MDRWRTFAAVRGIVAGLALAALAGGPAPAGSKDELKEHLSKLADANPQVRERAVLGLWDLASDGRGVELALPAIIGALADDDPGVRGLACHSLAIAGHSTPGANLGELRSAIYPLAGALSDEDRTVREQAVFALASIARRLAKEGDDDALLPLWYAVDRLDGVGDLGKEFKGHPGEIRQAYEVLQGRADDLAGRPEGD